MKTESNIKLGVSLYSYQDNYYFHKHDLEGCMAAAAGAGATGIEIFSDAMIPEWPYITDEFVDRWNGMLYRYGLEAVCLDHFSDRAMWHNKLLTDDEMYERGVMYLKAARKLGCKYIRLLHDAHIGKGLSAFELTTPAIVERLLPVAQECDVIMALECHAPSGVADPIQLEYLEAAERLNIPYVGLQVDFSTYEYCMSSANINFCVYKGCTREVLEHLRDKQREAYFSGKAFVMNDILDDFKDMKLTEEDKKYLDPTSFIYQNSSKFIGGNFYDGKFKPHDWENHYKSLQEYASKIVYCHAKFYDIDKNNQVDNMDYPKIFDALKKGGYKGYICSEFEGNRLLNVNGWCDEISYVNRHHKLMRKCLGL
jgi:sugar phosphate isomerase/epimerase